MSDPSILSVLAEICLASKNTAASWVRRGAIPVRVWPSLLSSDRWRKLGLTSDELVALHAAPQGSGCSAAFEVVPEGVG